MKNAIVKLGFSLLFFFTAQSLYAADVPVTIERVSPERTNQSTVNFIIKFDAAVTGFTASDITLGGAAANGLTVTDIDLTANAHAGWYDVEISGITDEGELTVSLAGDVVTEGNPAATESVFYDITGPLPTITKPGSQNDPTQGETQIEFTVTFNEAVTGFDENAITLTDATGAATLASVTETTPGTVFKVLIDVDAPNATGGEDVEINIAAGSVVQDEAGNGNQAAAPTGRNNKVEYAGVAPEVESPPTATSGLHSITISGKVTFDGGVSGVQRGYVWDNSSTVTITDDKTQVGTGEGPFTGSAETGLNADTRYWFRVWADNGIGGIVLSTTASIYTLTDEPQNGSTITATGAATDSVHLSFTKFQGNTRADGIVILRKQGSAPTGPPDGQAPVVGQNDVIAIITDDQQTTYEDYNSGLVEGTQYYYAAVPFAWHDGDGGIPYTYNYKSPIIANDTRTFSKKSFIRLNSSPTPVAYYNKTAATISSSTDGVSIASLTVIDGVDGTTDDADGRATELRTLTVHVDGVNLINDIALVDGTTLYADTPLGGGDYKFTIGAGNILTKDDNDTGDGSPDQFDIIVSFNLANITDGAPISVTVIEATTQTNNGSFPSGSEFEDADAGGAVSNRTVDVVASKLVFTGTSITDALEIHPNEFFTITITAKDANNLVDLDGGGTVTLTKTAGLGDLTSTDGLDRVLSASGTATWTNLKISAALDQTITATLDNPGIDDTHDYEVISRGVSVTGPTGTGGVIGSNGVFCFNSTASTMSPPNASDPSFTLMTTPITILEGDGSDFKTGTGQTFSLILPSGFIFNKAKTPSVSSSGTDISNTAAFDAYVGDNILRIKYTISGLGGVTPDQIIINNLPIKYTDTLTVTAAPIYRVGGSAVQTGNADSDNKVLGLLSVKDGQAIDFENASGGSLTQTAFSRTNGPVVLRGKNAGGTLAGPGAVFSGEGVTFDGVQYKFYPANVADGSHEIKFTYTEGNTCVSYVTKTYSVFSSLITGLSSTYCINNGSVTIGKPTTPAPTIYTCIDPLDPFGLIIREFQDDDPSDWNYQYLDYDPVTFARNWVDLPNKAHFDPAHPDFKEEIAKFGGLDIQAYYWDKCFPGPFNYWWLGQSFIKINPVPVFSFSPVFGNGVCATDTPYDMVGSTYTPANGFDEFWSTPEGSTSGTKPGITGDRSIGFKFEPTVANPLSSNADIRVQINYRHKDGTTLCADTVSRVIDVWGKPLPVDAADISIKGESNVVAAQFCHQESLKSFFVDEETDVFHKWAYNPASKPAVEGDEFALSPNDFANTAGVPNIGAVANYKVSRIVHRQFIIKSGEEVQVFAGCESDPLDLSVTIMQPTTVNAGGSTTICEGNPVDLSAIGASITSPTAGLNGTWTSASGNTAGFKAANKTTLADRFNTTGGATPAKYYYPTAAEIAARNARLTLTTDDPTGPCGQVVAELFVTINPGVSITFPVNPVRACAAETITVDGVVSNATLGFHWEKTAGLGDVDPATINRTTVTYKPNDFEINQGGTVVLTLETVDPDDGGPCEVVSNTVTLLISQPPRIDAGDDYEICEDQPIILSGEKPANSSATGQTWSTLDATGSIVNGSSLSASYDLNPDPIPVDNSSSRSITFTLKSADPVFPNVCTALSDQVTVTLHAVPKAPTPTNATPTYCVGDNILSLSASGTNLTWYKSDLTQFGEGPSLPVDDEADVEKKVTYYVSQKFDENEDSGFAGCESTTAQITIIVNPLPVPTFDFAKQCLGDLMEFTNHSTLAQPTDPADPARSITAYQWNFDDGLLNTEAAMGAIPAGTQDGRTTGTYENPRHQFKNPGAYRVKLTAFTSNGCSASYVDELHPIPVGSVPVADFTVNKQCDEDETVFTSSTGLDSTTPVTYAWNFGDGSTATDSEAQSPVYQFTGVGTYDVKLILKTNLDCADTIVKQVSIFPYIKSFPYIENFESPNHGWVPEGKVFNGTSSTVQTSWNLLTSAGSITSDPGLGAGAKFWATHTNAGADTYYYNNERSVLYGPCVDMTQLQRPVLAFDYFNDTEAKGDGVYIEYLDENDPEGVWTRLGGNVGGLNWYNESSIGGLSLLGDVGQNLSQFGWSGATDAWTTGRYNMDDFHNMDRVRFRVVFGSNFSAINTDVYDGFALDYFRLEPRNRVVLVENFTSRSSSAAFAENRQAFQDFPSVAASSEVVKIEYHTGIPVLPGDSQDPIFAQNPMDPNARASFYGLSAVPRGYIDGYSNLAGAGMFSTGDWAGNYYSTESLKTSPLEINIETPSISDGIMRVKGTVTAKDFDLPGNKYSLYVVVVEREVGTDAFVLRKMLPSASGRKVPLTVKGQSFGFDETWSVDKSYLSDNPKLIAIAFVQSDIADPKTGERAVLQAAYNDGLPQVNFTTGLEIPLLEQTAMYPNPADHLVNIELPQPTVTGVDVKVIDQLGRAVQQSRIEVGGNSVSIDTSTLAGAVYIVQMKENGISTTRRLLVTHKH